MPPLRTSSNFQTTLHVSQRTSLKLGAMSLKSHRYQGPDTYSARTGSVTRSVIRQTSHHGAGHSRGYSSPARAAVTPCGVSGVSQWAPAPPRDPPHHTA